MKILSHRGFHRHVPENTLAAFEAAIALGVDGIETDIRLTSDGQIILFHNPQTPDGTDIETLTQPELSQQVGYHVPRLDEAINLTRHQGQEFCWNLELKTKDSFSVLPSALEALNPNTKILFTSFWHDGIAHMALEQQTKTAPDTFGAEYGLLWASHPHQFDRPQWFEDLTGITTLVFYQERISAQLIDQCQHKGKACWAYGDRSPDNRSTLKTWNIDGLITDYPDQTDRSAR